MSCFNIDISERECHPLDWISNTLKHFSYNLSILFRHHNCIREERIKRTQITKQMLIKRLNI